MSEEGREVGKPMSKNPKRMISCKTVRDGSYYRRDQAVGMLTARTTEGKTKTTDKKLFKGRKNAANSKVKECNWNATSCVGRNMQFTFSQAFELPVSTFLIKFLFDLFLWQTGSIQTILFISRTFSSQKNIKKNKVSVVGEREVYK